MRIAAASDQRDLLVSAFKHTGRNGAQIVFINRSAAGQPVTVNLQNLNLSALQSCRTSAGENHVRAAAYQVTNHKFSFVIPSHAIMTLAGTMAATKDAIPPAPPKGVMIKGK